MRYWSEKDWDNFHKAVAGITPGVVQARIEMADKTLIGHYITRIAYGVVETLREMDRDSVVYKKVDPETV